MNNDLEYFQKMVAVAWWVVTMMKARPGPNIKEDFYSFFRHHGLPTSDEFLADVIAMVLEARKLSDKQILHVCSVASRMQMITRGDVRL